MATAAQIQVELGLGPFASRIVRSEPQDVTYERHYVCGGVDAPGRSRWVRITLADSAATAAAAILTALRA